MRIAICNAVYPTPSHPRIIGGAEVFVRQFAEELTKRGDEVLVLRFSPSGAVETEVVNGVTIHYIPVHNLYPPFEERKNPLLRTGWHLVDDWQKADPAVAGILSSFAPDVFHSNTLNGLTADVWRVAKRQGIPVVHTLHDYYLLCPRCSRFKHGRSCAGTCGECALLSFGRRRRSQMVDAVVGVSQRILDIHVGDGVFDKTPHKYVVHNAANPAMVFTAQRPAEGVLNIGYLGRFSEEKGVRLLAEAANLLPAGTVRLSLAGHAAEDERQRLRSLAPSVDMDFVGFVNPSDFYATVDVVAMPSIWEEPSGLAFLDALAAGRPVLTSGYGGIAEMFEDGVTGWIAQPNPQIFSEAIRRLLDEPQLIAAAHQWLAERRNTRTLSDMVDEYRQIYKAVRS